VAKKESRIKTVRRVARRRGYHVSLSRVRDPLATGFGRWTVTGPGGGRISPKGGWTLEQVEHWLGRMGKEAADAEAHQAR
jgi:hypothetical protein